MRSIEWQKENHKIHLRLLEIKKSFYHEEVRSCFIGAFPSTMAAVFNFIFPPMSYSEYKALYPLNNPQTSITLCVKAQKPVLCIKDWGFVSQSQSSEMLLWKRRAKSFLLVLKLTSSSSYSFGLKNKKKRRGKWIELGLCYWVFLSLCKKEKKKMRWNFLNENTFFSNILAKFLL